jgi:hypothetical protein
LLPKTKVEARLPAIRITEMILEVDARTGFSNAFTHLRSGRTTENKLALCTAILDDGNNLGPTRMADVSTATHQLDWRLHLDTHRHFGSQTAQAKRFNARGVISICSQMSDRFTTFVSDGLSR